MWKSKICEKEFDESQEHVAPCGHAFHMSCIFSSLMCSECKTMIYLDQVKVLCDHTVSSGTEKEQEIEMEEQENEVEELETEMKELETNVKQPEIESNPEDQNILDGGKEANKGVYDMSAYVQTLEDRVQTYSKRMNELTDLNEVLSDSVAPLRKANSCLRMQLTLFHNHQKLTIASEDDFKRMLASISEESNAIQKLVFYCTLLRKQLLQTFNEQGKMKRRRVGSVNLEEPSCSNQRNEQCSNVEEKSDQNIFDLLSTNCREQAEKPSCSNQKHEPNCNVGKQIDGNEVKLLDTDERDRACSSSAIINQLAGPINVPSDIDASDPWVQEELGWLYKEMFRC